MIKRIISIFLIWKATILLFAAIAASFIPLKTDFVDFFDFGKNMPYFAWIWGNFDGMRYMQIAKSGYLLLQQGFFPLYPLLISIFSPLFEYNFLLSSLFISNAAILLSLLLLPKLISFNKNISLSLLFAVILTFPTSFFYQASYNDSLFFLLAMLTIFFARKNNLLLASAFAGLAMLARLNGLALFPFILFEYIQGKQKDETSWSIKRLKELLRESFSLKRILKSKVYFSLLIPLSFLGYLTYIHIKFGNFLLLFTSMKIWNQDQIILPIQTFVRYIKILFLYPRIDLNYAVAILELSFVLFYIFLLVFSFKKIRLSYWIFMASALLIPSFTGTFQGMPRYALHLFPIFLTITLFLQKMPLPLRYVYFAICIILSFILIGLFTRGYFVA